MKTIFIGVGNGFRRDDGAGLYIVRQLRKKLESITTISFAESHGEGSSLMEMWQSFDKVFLFDAVMINGEPGKRYYLQASRENIPTDFFKYSSHAFSLAEAVEMARVLGKLPESLEVYGIEGKDFSHGEELCPEVLHSCHELIEEIIHAWTK